MARRRRSRDENRDATTGGGRRPDEVGAKKARQGDNAQMASPPPPTIEAIVAALRDDLARGEATRSMKQSMVALATASKREANVPAIVAAGGIPLCVQVLNNLSDGNFGAGAGDAAAGPGPSIGRATSSETAPRSRARATWHAMAASIRRGSVEHVLKNVCLVLGLVAMTHRREVIESGGIAALCNVLRSYSAACVQGRSYGSLRPSSSGRLHPLASSTAPSSGSVGTLVRRACGALTNLAHEDARAKNVIREHGGVLPLALLLRARESAVQVAAAGTLKAIAFRNDDNKNQIVESGALPSLVVMLKAADPVVHYEAVAVLSNLVHSSAHIKKLVLNGGALQPLVNLLTSMCTDSRREAALLLGQFANVQVSPIPTYPLLTSPLPPFPYH